MIYDLEDDHVGGAYSGKGADDGRRFKKRGFMHYGTLGLKWNEVGKRIECTYTWPCLLHVSESLHGLDLHVSACATTDQLTMSGVACF
jgi:hypothetical protein